jgi:hypothetical protein
VLVRAVLVLAVLVLAVLVLAVLALAAVAAPSRLIEAASTLPPAASQMRLRIPFSLTREDPQ